MNITREQRVIAGPRMEVSFYEIFPGGRRIPERAPKTKLSTEAQRKYNHDQAVKKIVLLVAANFSRGDILLDPNFDDDHLPETMEEVRRIIQNYLLRLKRWRKRNGLGEMKYLYAIEKTVRKSGKHKGRPHWHVHMVLSKMPRGVVEDLWPDGVRVNAKKYQPERFGKEAAAKYIGKDTGTGNRRFAYSRNLKKPEKLPPRDGRITQRAVKQMVLKREHDAEYWQRKYPGYVFYGYEKPPELCRNPYNGYWYLTVILYREETSKKKKKKVVRRE